MNPDDIDQMWEVFSGRPLTPEADTTSIADPAARPPNAMLGLEPQTLPTEPATPSLAPGGMAMLAGQLAQPAISQAAGDAALEQQFQQEMAPPAAPETSPIVSPFEASPSPASSAPTQFDPATAAITPAQAFDPYLSPRGEEQAFLMDETAKAQVASARQAQQMQTQAATEIAQLQQEQARLQGEEAEAQAKMILASKEKAQARVQSSMAEQRAAEAQEPDPRRWWSDRTSAEKAMFFVTGALQAFTKPTEVPVVAGYVKDLIDQDVAIQAKRIEGQIQGARARAADARELNDIERQGNLDLFKARDSRYKSVQDALQAEIGRIGATTKAGVAATALLGDIQEKRNDNLRKLLGETETQELAWMTSEARLAASLAKKGKGTGTGTGELNKPATMAQRAELAKRGINVPDWEKGQGKVLTQNDYLGLTAADVQSDDAAKAGSEEAKAAAERSANTQYLVPGLRIAFGNSPAKIVAANRITPDAEKNLATATSDAAMARGLIHDMRALYAELQPGPFDQVVTPEIRSRADILARRYGMILNKGAFSERDAQVGGNLVPGSSDEDLGLRTLRWMSTNHDGAARAFQTLDEVSKDQYEKQIRSYLEVQQDANGNELEPDFQWPDIDYSPPARIAPSQTVAAKMPEKQVDKAVSSVFSLAPSDLGEAEVAALKYSFDALPINDPARERGLKAIRAKEDEAAAIRAAAQLNDYDVGGRTLDALSRKQDVIKGLEASVKQLDMLPDWAPDREIKRKKLLAALESIPGYRRNVTTSDVLSKVVDEGIDKVQAQRAKERVDQAGTLLDLFSVGSKILQRK